MHYTLTSTYEELVKDIANAMDEVSDFVEKEIIEYLPEEAIEDFEASIAKYRCYSNRLRQCRW